MCTEHSLYIKLPLATVDIKMIIYQDFQTNTNCYTINKSCKMSKTWSIGWVSLKNTVQNSNLHDYIIVNINIKSYIIRYTNAWHDYVASAIMIRTNLKKN